MVDLEHQAVIGWLIDMQPARTNADWPPPVRPIETTGEAPALLERLGAAIEILGVPDRGSPPPLEIGDAAAGLREILAQLGAARMLRIISALQDSLSPEDAAVLTCSLTARESPAGRALAAAMAASARTTLRGRLIAEQRLAALARATTSNPHPTSEETP